MSCDDVANAQGPSGKCHNLELYSCQLANFLRQERGANDARAASIKRIAENDKGGKREREIRAGSL